jgi:hypothetical protein
VPERSDLDGFDNHGNGLGDFDDPIRDVAWP